MVFDDSWILRRKDVQTTRRCIRTGNVVNGVLTSTDSLMVEAGA